MRAVIPVAGFGKRLKPHTYTHPKVLLNVAGKPILGHILDKLLKEGINKASFIIGHLGDKIIEYVGDKYPKLSAEYVEQKEMLGLGHAIYTAIPTFKNEEEIFIILGDTIFDVDLTNVFKNNQSSLGVKKIKDPSRFGVAEVKKDFVVKLIEKPRKPVSNLALVGLYYIANAVRLTESLNELIEKDIRTRGELQLTDALQIMINKGEKMTTFNVDGWYDCGKPETLLSTNQYLLSKNNTDRHFDDAIIKPPVFIAENAVVKSSIIGPYTTIAEDCEVVDSVIQNSIISSGAKVYKSLLENSLVGSNGIVKGDFKKINVGDFSEIKFY